MVLFTKEIFVQLTTLQTIHINVNTNPFIDEAGKRGQNEVWQIFIQGTVGNAAPGYEQFSTYITCSSKEDTYRMFNELMRQVVDSAELPTLNNKLFDDVLTEKQT